MSMEHHYTQWGAQEVCHEFILINDRKIIEKAFRLLTGIVKRYLSAAVWESRPWAVVDGSSLHNTGLGGVRLGCPHQHTDSGGEKKRNHARHAGEFFILQMCAVNALNLAHPYISMSFLFHNSVSLCAAGI